MVTVVMTAPTAAMTRTTTALTQMETVHVTVVMDVRMTP